MFRIVCVIILAATLAGCVTDGQTLVQDRYTVVTPPPELYNCPQLKKLPDYRTLTDLQVGRLLATLAKNNKICGISVAALKQFYNDAKRQYGS